eukprot:SAG11_NODE_21979_length_414_cov_1.923810_1_plen_23_part_01
MAVATGLRRGDESQLLNNNPPPQ